MGRCPSCGSTDYRAIAPTLVECQGEKPETHYVGDQQVGWHVPGRIPHIVPQYATTLVRCLHRRPEIAMEFAHESWPTCRCGTFAVGRCVVCETPICGDDSQRVNGARFCTGCATSTEWSVADMQALTGG